VGTRPRMKGAGAARLRPAKTPRAPSRAGSGWWVLAGCAALPFIAAGLLHDRFASSILAVAGLKGLFAVSWLFLAASGQPSLGHALPYGAGAYAVAFLARRLPLESSGTAGFTPAVLTAAAALAGACAGGLQGRLTRRLTPALIAAVTLATVQAAHSLATMWTAPVMRGVSEADTAIPVPPFPAGDRGAMWIAAAAMAAGVLCVGAVLRSRAGVALRTAAADERDAAALGFDAPRLRFVAFVASGAIAGIAGAFAAQFAGRVTPGLFSWHASLFVAAAAMLGGPFTVAGPAAAGYVIAAAAQIADVPAGVELAFFAAVVAAAAVRDPQRVLALSFGWNHRPPASRVPEAARPGTVRTADAGAAGR